MTHDIAAGGDPLDPPPRRVHDSRRTMASVVSLGGGELASRGIAFIAAAYLARTLGPSNFGIVGFATGVAGYFALAVSAGFNEMGAREVARRPRDAGALASGVMVVRLGLAAAALAALAIVTRWIEQPTIVTNVILLAGLSFFSLALDTSWVYKGLERNGSVASALILGQIVYACTTVVAVRHPGDVVRVPIAQFLGDGTAALALTLPLLLRHARAPDVRDGWVLLRRSGPLTLSRFLRTIIFTADVILLGLLVDKHAVGLYTAAYRICFVLLAVAVAVQTSYLPAFTRAAGRGPKDLREIGERSLEVAAALAAPAIAGGALLAAPVLNAVFGPAYVEGVWAFRLVLLSIGFIFISMPVHNLLLASEHISAEMLCIAGAAALNVGLNLVLIPRYGLTAAAAMTAVSEGFILAAGLLLVQRLGIRPRLGTLWRPAAAASVMSVCLASLGAQWALLLRLAAGAIIYAFLLTVLGGIPRDARRAHATG